MLPLRHGGGERTRIPINSLMRLLSKKLSIPRVDDMPRRFKVTPAAGRRSRSVLIGRSGTASVNLGRLAELGPQRDVELSLSTEHVVAIVGKRGSGKTHTLGVLVEGLASPQSAGVRAGADRPDHAIVVFDT